MTSREREVLALMAEGWSNGAIARTLVITVWPSRRVPERRDHLREPGGFWSGLSGVAADA